MKNTDPLITYLATHDAPCPGCGYNLRGLRESSCPECGYQTSLEALIAVATKRSWHTLKLIITIINLVPVVISAALTAFFAFVSIGDDTAASFQWSLVFVGHVIVIWLLAMPIRRLILASLAWAWIFNPLLVFVFVFVSDTFLGKAIGLPTD